MNKQLLIVSGFSGFIIACIAMYAAGFGIFRQNEYVAICLFLSLIVGVLSKEVYVDNPILFLNL